MTSQLPGVNWDSDSDVSASDTDSVYVPTSERPMTEKVSRTDFPNEVAFIDTYRPHSCHSLRGTRVSALLNERWRSREWTANEPGV